MNEVMLSRSKVSDADANPRPVFVRWTCTAAHEFTALGRVVERVGFWLVDSGGTAVRWAPSAEDPGWTYYSTDLDDGITHGYTSDLIDVHRAIKDAVAFGGF